MEISVEKLGELQPEDCVICDIRGEHDRAYGFIPGSVGISAEELLTSPPADGKKLIIYCARGIVSVDLADELCGRGLEAYSLEGGYIAWLRAEMRRRNDEELRERVEQSIRKKFRVSLMSKFIKALKTYQLVNEGDRVAVCISGGKDSMLMAKLFQELKRYSEVNFEVKYLVMDPGYNADNRRIIEDNARALGIPVTIFETDIFESVYNVEKSPCYLCARMRRGYLYRFAQELGCNKIALGHHYDDVRIRRPAHNRAVHCHSGTLSFLLLKSFHSFVFSFWWCAPPKGAVPHSVEIDCLFIFSGLALSGADAPALPRGEPLAKPESCPSRQRLSLWESWQTRRV